jgi:hypothetical protein
MIWQLHGSSAVKMLNSHGRCVFFFFFIHISDAVVALIDAAALHQLMKVGLRRFLF